MSSGVGRFEKILSTQRIIVLGDECSGKTSLIKSLTSGVMQLSHKPTDGLEVTVWKPSVQPFLAAEIVGELDKDGIDGLDIEIWDTTGRKCCWPIHQTIFIPSAMYLIVFNCLQQESVDNSLEILQLIQQKVLGSQVLFIYSRSATANFNVEQVEENVLTAVSSWEKILSDTVVDHMNQLRESSSTPHIMAEVARLEDLLTNSLQIHPNILGVDMEAGEGLQNCMRTILSMILNSTQLVLDSVTEQTGDDDLLAIYSQLTKLDQQQQIVVPRSIEDLKTTNQHIISQLVSQGHLLEVEIPRTTRTLVDSYICLNPRKLANNSCLFHFDTLDKHLQLEAYRFWPKDSGCSRPDPGLLIKALEEIPSNGVIREVLFPLIWQENTYTEEQIRLMLMLLVENDILGEMSEHTKPAQDHSMDCLLLPNYPSLSVDRFYLLPIIGVPNISKPGVNWSEELFTGDVHFGLVYSFPNRTIPNWFLNKLLARCNRYASGWTYRYQWDKGVLCKFLDELTMHIYYGEDMELCISCRGPYEDSSILRLMWLAMKPVIQAVMSTLSQYPGIIYQLDIEAKGSPLVTRYNTESTKHSTVTFRHSFWSCLSSYLSGEHVTKNNGCQIDLSTVFSSLKENMQSVKYKNWVEALYPMYDIQQLIDVPSLSGIVAQCPRLGEKTLHKGCKVNWKAEIAEEIDMQKKEYIDSHQPHLVSDKAMRKHLRRIARSLVTSVVTSAVATVLVQQGEVTSKQECIAEILAGAVNAGYRGDTQAALCNMNKLINIIPKEAKEPDYQKKSRVCVLL